MIQKKEPLTLQHFAAEESVKQYIIEREKNSKRANKYKECFSTLMRFRRISSQLGILLFNYHTVLQNDFFEIICEYIPVVVEQLKLQEIRVLLLNAIECKTYPEIIEYLYEESENESLTNIVYLTKALTEPEHYKYFLEAMSFNFDSFAINPLFSAIQAKKPEFVKVLLEFGANPNTAHELLKTPLHVAVAQGEKKSVLHLLEHGANVSAKGGGMFTAIYHARCLKDPVIKNEMEVILSRGMLKRLKVCNIATDLVPNER